MFTVKKCTKCQEVKSISEFYKNAMGRDGLRSHCKICDVVHARKYQKANPEKRSARHRQYYAVNSEKVLANARKYYVANLEKTLAKNRKWRKANPEKMRACHRAYLAANLEKMRANNRKRYAANPEKERLAWHRRRARKQANGIFLVTPKEIKRMKAKLCYLCDIAPSTTIEHIIPVTRGGRYSIGNFLGACKPCNSSKYDKLLVEYRLWKRAA